MNNEAVITKAGKLCKDGTHALTIEFRMSESKWQVGFSTSHFMFARCEYMTMTVPEADACIRAIHDWLKENLYIPADHSLPKFSWHMEGTVANWTRIS